MTQPKLNDRARDAARSEAPSAAPRPALTAEHVDKLHRLRSAGTRSDLAGVIASDLLGGALTKKERRLAVQVLDLLARDIDRKVREAVSEHLTHCGALPPELARELADDIETVSLPVIQYATLMSDDDLVRIIGAGSTEKQVAVAKRETISQTVSEALVDTEKAEVVGTLLANAGADISEPSLLKAVTTFKNDEAIQSQLVGRRALPIAVVHALVTTVSTALRERLIERHHLPRGFTAGLISQGQERAIADVMASAEGEDLAAQLRELGTLTPMFLLRMLYNGDLHFVHDALAALARVPHASVLPALVRAESRDFETLYKKAGLPSGLLRAFRVGLTVLSDAGRRLSRNELQQRIIDGLVRNYESVCPADLENVLRQLSRYAAA